MVVVVTMVMVVMLAMQTTKTKQQMEHVATKQFLESWSMSHGLFTAASSL
jgi:hypothetical protein